MSVEPDSLDMTDFSRRCRLSAAGAVIAVSATAAMYARDAAGYAVLGVGIPGTAMVMWLIVCHLRVRLRPRKPLWRRRDRVTTVFALAFPLAVLLHGLALLARQPPPSLDEQTSLLHARVSCAVAAWLFLHCCLSLSAIARSARGGGGAACGDGRE